MKFELSDIAAGLTLFNGVDKKIIASFLEDSGANKSLRHYKKDEVIITPKDKCKKIMLVVSGKFGAYSNGMNDRKHLVNSFGPSTILGGTLVFGSEDAIPGHITVLDPGEVIVMDVARFREAILMPKYVTVFANFQTIMTDYLTFALKKIAVLGCVNLSDRILTYLEWFTPDANGKVVIPYDRLQFAEFLGANRAALSRSLGQLVDAGEITTRKRVFHILKKRK